MTTPSDPTEARIPLDSPPALRTDTPAARGAAFSGSLRSSALLRVSVVVVATVVLLVSAALTFGASPTPTAPGTGTETPPGPGTPGLRDGALGGPRGGLRLDGRAGRFAFRNITIAAIDGSNLSLRTEDGWTRTITVTDATTITKAGATIALGDLRVGDQIRFRQTRNTDGSFTIQAINVVLPSVAGEVTAVTGDTFTIRTRGNVTWTITVNGSTKYMLGRSNATKEDVKVGSRVGVAGAQNGNAALTASVVHIAASRVVGKVTSKTADTITIERVRGGTATIHVSGSTTYRVAGKDNASLADIAVGAIIGAEGRQRADGSLDATVVGAAPKLGRMFGRLDGLIRPKDGPRDAPNATPNATPGSYSVG